MDDLRKDIEDAFGVVKHLNRAQLLDLRAVLKFGINHNLTSAQIADILKNDVAIAFVATEQAEAA